MVLRKFFTYTAPLWYPVVMKLSETVNVIIGTGIILWAIWYVSIFPWQ